ncbi:hypothetical protein SOVF_035390 [Spinacia oleracea]|nr:hypothetical protein SOVF_035390 [Spinacia oleracea]
MQHNFSCGGGASGKTPCKEIPPPSTASSPPGPPP